MAPQVSWHRGGGEGVALASREAFLEAARRGAENIEVDVRRTADGVLVCVHDASIPGLGPVSQVVLGQHPESGVLTYRQFLDDLDSADGARRSRVHLDLKSTGYELEAVDELIDRGRPFFVTTSELSSITLIRRERPQVLACLTVGRARSGHPRWERATILLEDVVPLVRIRRSRATGVALHRQLATRPLLWWCRRQGLFVAVWTVDDDEELRRWLSRRVDVVTTNRPRRALEIRDGKG